MRVPPRRFDDGNLRSGVAADQGCRHASRADQWRHGAWLAGRIEPRHKIFIDVGGRQRRLRRHRLVAAQYERQVLADRNGTLSLGRETGRQGRHRAVQPAVHGAARLGQAVFGPSKCDRSRYGEATAEIAKWLAQK